MDAEIKKSLRRWRKLIVLLCLIGLGLSLYAVYVEMSNHKDPDYKAMCDISETISCSAVFTSEYGTGLGIVGKVLGDDSPLNQPNGIYGIIVYSLLALLSLLAFPIIAKLLIVMAITANVTSIYLGYILLFVLKDYCVVCFSTYAVNFLILICAVKNLGNVKKLNSIPSEDDFGYIGQGVSKKRV